MSRLRVGVVGAGVMGRRHLAALSQCSMAEVIGVADHHADPSALGAPGLRHLEDLLALRPDAVIIATPAGSHRSLAERCLAAGAHVLVEKPLASSLEDARAVEIAAHNAGRLAAVGHVERFSPVAEAIRRAMRLQPPRTIATVRIGSRPQRVRDVGVLLDLAVHDIDLVRWSTGRDYVDVEAYSVEMSEDDHETLAVLAGRLDDGTVVTHEVSWSAPQPTRRWTLAPDRGPSVVVDLTSAGNIALVAQDDAFVAACLGQMSGSSLASAADGVAAVEIALRGLPQPVLRRAQEGPRQRTHPQPTLQWEPVVGA